MKLAQWARENGLTRATACKLFHTGMLPVEAEQLSTGTILVYPKKEKQFIVYARVSSSDQKSDLDRQVARIMKYAAAHKLSVIDTVTEIGSGLNGNRKKLKRMLEGTPHNILVEHRDRLCRFGFEYLVSALQQANRTIVVADPTEVPDDIVRDLHEVLVSMCARLYGKRAAANKAARALEEMQK